jgi:hypothetical protein
MAEAATETGIEIKLKTGEVIKAPNAEEAFKIAVKMAEDTKDVYKTEKEARERLEAQVADLSSRVQQQQTKPKGDNGFDQQEYYRLLNQDAIAAANYVDAHRFGLSDPAQVPQRFAYIGQKIDELDGNMLAGSFLQQHAEDFPATPDSARALRERVQAFASNGYPTTIDTLNMAYNQLIEEGKIKPNEPQREEQRDEPNPSLVGAGQHDIPESEVKKAETMSDKDLEAYLRSKGML